MLINPLFYWAAFLTIFVGMKRIKMERKQFGRRIFPVFEEFQHTWFISIVGGIVISLCTILFGIIFTLETVIILIVAIIVLSITARVTFLSPVYSLGITFFLAVLLRLYEPPFLESFNYQIPGMEQQLISIVFLAGILLFIEGLFVTSKKAASYPEMALSERGVWVGQHAIKRMAMIPFFLLLPTTGSGIQLPLFPTLQMGENAYMLVLFPFIIGYQYKVRAQLPGQAANKIGRSTQLLGVIVISCAIAGMYYPILAIFAMVLAIGGREWITYRHKLLDTQKAGIFHPLDRGIKVLATIPGSPAARLGIEIGETILKVNGHTIHDTDEFYGALQNSGAFFKLAVLNINGEIRFINSPFFEGDHYALGLIFIKKQNGI